MESLVKQLTNGSSARGAQMGRRDSLPADRKLALKFQMEALRLVDGDYDVKGAYWGGTPGTRIYFARASEVETRDQFGNAIVPEVFVRARSRADAKNQIRELLPNASFYR